MTEARKRRSVGAAKTATSSGIDRHKWEFKARFRRHPFGWKSQPAITRIRQAVAELRKVERKDPVLAAERLGNAAEVKERIREIIAADGARASFVAAVLGGELGR